MNKVFLASAALAAVLGCATKNAANFTPPKLPHEAQPPHANNVPFKLGMARYTMCAVSLDRAIEIMKACDCKFMGLKEGTISYDATDEEIAAYKAKFAEAGIEVVSAGPLYFSTEEELDKCMSFAKRYGMKYISVVPFEPNPKIAHLMYAENEEVRNERRKILPDPRDWRIESDKAMDILERLVKKYDLRAAVHNHGPDNAQLYATGEAALKRIGNRDKRIGVCIDVGHERRAGLDPVQFIKKHGDRIVEVHLKNIVIDPVKNYAMPGPDGELDIPGIMQALSDTGFDGYCLVEYEKEFTCNEPALLRSFGYYRGCMDSVRRKAYMAPVPAGANTLTAKEKAEGWELLFDGKHLPKDKFVGVKEDCKVFPKKGWYVRDGYITMYPMRTITPEGRWIDLPPEDQKLANGGDIVTIKKYGDFEMTFDFRLTWAANSGVKYFYNEGQHQNSAEEYQILDPNHPDYDKPNHAGVIGVHRIAALYDLKAANGADKVVAKLGAWNHGRIVSKGKHVEHWLNGVKVLEYERGSAEFRKWVKDSKYAAWEDKGAHWGEAEKGRILLQDHSDSTVSFCNIKIREI